MSHVVVVRPKALHHFHDGELFKYFDFILKTDDGIPHAVLGDLWDRKDETRYVLVVHGFMLEAHLLELLFYLQVL